MDYKTMYNLYKSKNGEIGTPLRVVMVLVIVVFILFGFMSGISRVTDSTAFANEFIAKDFALNIETLLAVPGDVIIDYSQEISNKTIEIEKGKVVVYEEGKEIAKWTVSFVESETVKINYGKFEPNQGEELKLRLIKNGNEITITKDLEQKPGLAKLSCPYFSTKDINWENKNILIDVSHRDDDDDLGFKSDNLIEAEIVERIADYLRSLKPRMPNLEFTRGSGINLIGNREEKITQSTEVIISLNVGRYTSSLNEIRAYINPSGQKIKESNKLACLILNSIEGSSTLKDIDFTLITIVPAEKGSPAYEMLDKGSDKIAVSLEIGNINNEHGEKLLRRTADIGKAIQQGLFDYYN
ncbi:MAG: hypothetical protein U9R34_01090 [Nanoarchaeota archaeon]|nr:hypothetical protein [Nanoarchaeota archaeon]